MSDGKDANMADSESENTKSIDDTLRDTLRSIQSRGESVAEDPIDEAVSASVEETIPEEDKKLSEDVEAISDIEGEVDDKKEEKLSDISPLPNTWKKEAADAWAKADPILRAEVERREADIYKGIERYKQSAEFGQSIDEIVQPYQATLKSLGVTPKDAIRELLSADHKLRNGKPEEKEAYFSSLARAYGIDLYRVVQTAQSIDPRTFDLEQQNARLQQQIRDQQTRDQRSLEQSLDSEIAQFASDPKHTHFETVKMHMAALLQAGQAKDLSDAYEQAIYANPTTRAAVLQQQAAAMKEEAAKKATAAKAAAGVNIKSRPPAPTKQVIGSMEDTIRDTYRRIVG